MYSRCPAVVAECGGWSTRGESCSPSATGTREVHLWEARVAWSPGLAARVAQEGAAHRDVKGAADSRVLSFNLWVILRLQSQGKM